MRTRHVTGWREHELSGDEQRRLGVASELFTGRSIAVIDAPTEGLNDEAAHRGLVKLREHYGAGRSAIVSHQDSERLVRARVWRVTNGHMMIGDEPLDLDGDLADRSGLERRPLRTSLTR